MIEFLNNIIELILAIINSLGYFGIFIGMTLESSFFPFPSEIILIPAGALIAHGEMSFLGVFLAGLFGSLTGALVNYFLALYLGRATIDLLLDRYGKVLFLNKEKLRKSDNYFKQYGEITTFVGRLIPVIRQLISLPAGFSKMKLPKFILFTSLGAGIWTAILIAIGYFFGSGIDPIIKTAISLTLTFIAFLIAIIYLLVRKKK